MIAITREISPLIVNCELSHLDRQPVDFATAVEQHRTYEKYLEQFGCTIHRLPPAPELPDGVFVEDTAVVLPEVGIITRPGAKSRMPETVTMAAEVGKRRPLRHIKSPGTIDGGDVLIIGKRVWIGHSARSNPEGIKQFRNYLKPFGYSVEAVKVTKCLHLKTAVAPVDEDLMLINPAWANPDVFKDIRCIPVHPDEPYGANLIRFGDAALCSDAFPRTNEWLGKYGLDVHEIDYSEMAKAEAGLTCCSVIFQDVSSLTSETNRLWRLHF